MWSKIHPASPTGSGVPYAAAKIEVPGLCGQSQAADFLLRGPSVAKLLLTAFAGDSDVLLQVFNRVQGAGAHRARCLESPGRHRARATAAAPTRVEPHLLEPIFQAQKLC